LPYETRQALAHPDKPSMSVAMMSRAIREVIAIVARSI